MRAPAVITRFRSLVIAGGMAMMLAGIGQTSALAHDWDHEGDRDWRRQEWREEAWREQRWRAWREHEWWEQHRPYAYGVGPGYYVAPGYAYPPPAVVYPPVVYPPVVYPPVVYPPAPPPVVYGAPSLSLGFSFH